MIDWTLQPLRALLFAPGSEPRKLRRVATFGADAVVLDLEDAVADSEKVGARATVRDAIGGLGDAGVVVVRVNAGDATEEDVAATVGPGVDMVMLPKVESAAALHRADALIAHAEGRAGLALGSVRLLPIVETAAGLADCERLLADAPSRVLTAALGAGDLTADLGVALSRGGEEIAYARARLVVACRAAGLAAPIDGPWLRLGDLEGLAADSAYSSGIGFQGRVAVHPPQVEVVQGVYGRLTPEEAERDERVVEAFEAAEAEGVASLRVDVTFVDYPIYRLALERLRRHRAGNGRNR